MARVVLGVIGGVIGGPLGFAVGSAIGNAIDVKLKGPKTTGEPTIEGIRAQNSSFGVPINQVFGSFRIAGNCIWAAPIHEQGVVETDGGGCFTQEIRTTTYEYFGDFAIGLCQGPISSVRRIWADTKLIFNLDADNDEVVAIEGLQWRLYYGTEEQLPDALIESFEGAGNVPGFRGLAYAIFTQFPVTPFGNRMPQFTFEVVKDKSDTVPWSPVEPATSSAWGVDDLLMLPDGEHAIIESNGYWYRVDMISGEIVQSATFLDQYGNPDLPHYSKIDVDERGFIYAERNAGVIGPIQKTSVVRMSSKTLAIVAESGAGTYWTPYPVPPAPLENLAYFDMAVVANALHPYLYLIDWKGEIHVRMRDTLQWNTQASIPGQEGVAEYRYVVGKPAGLEARHLSTDDETGECWVISADDTSSYISRIRPVVGGWGIAYDLATSAAITSWSAEHYTGVGSPSSMAICYDPMTKQVILFVNADGTQCVFFDASFVESASLLHVKTLTSADGFHCSSWNKSYLRQGVQNGYLYYNGEYPGAIISRIDVVNRRVDRTWEANQSPTVMLFQGGGIYHPLTHAVLQVVNAPGVAYAKVLLDRFSENGVLLSSIVTDLCGQVGLGPSDIDVSELTDIVPGFFMGQRISARSAIESLASAYFFDGVESDGKLKFVKRGKSSIITIPEEHLAAHLTDQERPQELISTRQQELELPLQVDVTYVAQSADYDKATQRARRLLTSSEHLATLELPLSLTDNTAAQIAMNHLVLAWTQRLRHSFQIPRIYGYLDAADVVTIQEGGNQHVVRIERITNNGGVLAIEAANEDSSAYNSVIGGVVIPGHEGPVVYSSITYFMIADIPLLSSTTDSPGLYIIATAARDSWNGAAIFKSRDGGATWNQFVTVSRNGVVGETTTALADVPDPFVWDRGNTVTVVLSNADDSLVSSTEAAVLNGANHAVLGAEIIQFVTATEVGTGTYELSGLLRGRKGSDYATGTHLAGEAFGLLDADTIHFATYGVEEAGHAAIFRAVSAGMQFSSGVNQSLTPQVHNVRTLSPQHVKATRDPITGDINITWIRRTRYNGEWFDSNDVPLGETTEAYEVELWHPPTGSVSGFLVRNLAVTSQSATYTAAQQAQDGNTGKTISMIIYQMSTTIGRGEPSEVVTV